MVGTWQQHGDTGAKMWTGILLWMISNFWFTVMEAVKLSLSFLFGFTTSDKLKASSLQLFSTCQGDGLLPSDCSCNSITLTDLYTVNMAHICTGESGYWPLISLMCSVIFTCLVLAHVSLFELSYQLSCPFISHLILVIYFLYFPAPEACPGISWISVQTRLYSTHGKKL